MFEGPRRLQEKVRKFLKIFKDYSDIFNFEAKTHYRTSYFCGKFILASVDGFCVVPDPVKLLMKLGRRDLRNLAQVGEY